MHMTISTQFYYKVPKPIDQLTVYEMDEQNYNFIDRIKKRLDTTNGTLNAKRLILINALLYPGSSGPWFSRKGNKFLLSPRVRALRSALSHPKTLA